MFPPECMDFDHINGDKNYNVGKLVGHTRATIDAELAKCEVVCANCHRTRTKKRGQYVAERTDLVEQTANNT